MKHKLTTFLLTVTCFLFSCGNAFAWVYTNNYHPTEHHEYNIGEPAPFVHVIYIGLLIAFAVIILCFIIKQIKKYKK